MDTKKKELVGDFKNAGREWQPEGQPVPVRVHDFADDALGKVIPYGVHDLARNTGWVNVGIDHDTPELPAMDFMASGTTLSTQGNDCSRDQFCFRSSPKRRS